MYKKEVMRYAKASAAFASALLFGTENSSGLIKTLASSSGEALGNMARSTLQSNAAAESSYRDPMMPFYADDKHPFHNPTIGEYYDSAGQKIDLWNEGAD
ncbi:MAG: hypothetical protein L0J67_11380 [Halomonas sp.]|nr:hypothetical protein [Halomonas sp.]MDN6337213.1 hypothetical protein [Halomonas sp.]